MNTMAAFAMGLATQDLEPKVFDWDKAAQIIRDTGAQYAAAGLRDDWEHTGGEIYENGAPVKNSYTFLASTWATPELCVDGEYIECYKMQSQTPGWGCKTKWPASALAILQGKITDAEKVEG